MIDRLDELLNKFVSVFLLPIVNLLCISVIIYWSSRGFNVSGFIEKNIHLADNVSDDRLGFIAKFIQDNLSVITNITSTYRKEISDLSYIMAATTSALLVLAIYLFDRIVFYFGYLLPPTFNFDIEAYGRAAKNARHADALAAIFDVKRPVGTLYGIVRSYLGEKNTDASRLGFRTRLVKALDSSTLVIAYCKSYFFLTLFLLGYSLFQSSLFTWTGAGPALVVVTVALVCAIYYHSLCFQRLVDYDLLSFLWERSYNGTIKFDKVIVGAIPEHPHSSRARIGRWFLSASLLSRDG